VRLRQLGKPSRVVTYEGEDHSYDGGDIAIGSIGGNASWRGSRALNGPHSISQLGRSPREHSSQSASCASDRGARGASELGDHPDDDTSSSGPGTATPWRRDRRLVAQGLGTRPGGDHGVELRRILDTYILSQHPSWFQAAAGGEAEITIPSSPVGSDPGSHPGRAFSVARHPAYYRVEGGSQVLNADHPDPAR